MAGATCLVLGLTGVVRSEISWESLLVTPFIWCYFALLNRHVLHALIREIDFGSLRCIISVVALFVAPMALVTGDTRPAMRKRPYGYRRVVVVAALLYAFILVLYHANIWENYRSTVYYVGIGRGIEFHVASTGMGCAMTLGVLTGRYSWVILRSKDINPMVVIRATVVLRPLTKSAEPNPPLAVVCAEA